MEKKMKKMRPVSIKPIGNLILRKKEALKAARSLAPRADKKYFDPVLRDLDAMYSRLCADCKTIWEIPNPNI